MELEFPFQRPKWTHRKYRVLWAGAQACLRIGVRRVIRLFAAIAMPPAITEALAPLQHGVEGARWRPAESLHITLRFFGDVPEPTADDLDEQLEAVGGKRLELSLSGVGVFGEGRELRAIWAGLADSEPLRGLARRCESAARRAGLEPNTRKYAPHVTLAYLRGADPGEVAAWIQRNNLLKSEAFPVGEFGLYSSWSGRSGSFYRLEKAYALV
jgi:RNA 2',3'-cyclic 3'-phosphodiesterase